MAADTNLSEYNSVAQLLLVAFDDAEISEREGSGGKMYSYVPPERYRYRLLKAFPNGFTLETTVTRVGKLGIEGSTHFVGEVPEEGIRYDITVPCFEAWTFKSGTQDIIQPEQSYMKLASAGLKAFSREIGLGLHLYDKAPRTVNTSTRVNNPAPAASSTSTGTGNGNGIPNFDSEWDGSVHCTIGTKIKGQPWANATDDYLEFLTRDPEKANRFALKEIARRQSLAGQTGNASAAASVAASSSTNNGNAGATDEFEF